ncbi:MAG: HIRAN domain-containing protein [Thermoleophilia bacterium]
MGIFRRDKKAARPVETVTMTVSDLPNGWRVHLAGTSFRQTEIRGVLSVATKDPPEGIHVVNHKGTFHDEDAQALGWIEVILICEPDNKHDENAVAVLSMTHGQLGYLKAEWAAEWQPILLSLEKKGQRGTCPAYIRDTGHDALAVTLCLSTAEYAERSGEID